MSLPSLLPLKRLIDPRRPITYGIVQAGDDVDEGVPYIRPVDMVEHSGVPDPTNLRKTSPAIAAAYCRSTVRSGDVVVSIGPSYGKTMVVPSELDGANLTQGTARLAPARGVDRRCLRWALRSSLALEYWDSAVSGATFRALNLEPLSRTPIPDWHRSAQEQIADFLDAETARIDALIEKKQGMINLLESRWEVSVRERFRALEPRMRLKRRWRVIDCKHRTPAYVVEGYPVVSPGDLSPGRIDLSRCHRFVNEVDFRDLTEGRRPKRDDIIYSRNASAGIAAVVETDQPFCMGQDVCLITSSDEDQRFLMYALNSIAADQLAPIKIGSTITRINVDRIGELEVPVPPLEAQRQVADALDGERSRIDRLVERIRRQIDLLREHRQALITAAVTGQLDVTERQVAEVD